MKFNEDALIISLLFFLIYIVFCTPESVTISPDTSTDNISIVVFVSTPVILLYLNDGDPFEFVESAESYTTLVICDV